MSEKRTKDWHSYKEITVNMSLKEKIDYIATYYRWHIIATIVVSALIFSVAWITLTNRDAYLEIVFVSGFEQTIKSSQAAGNIDNENFMTGETAPRIFVNYAVADHLGDVLLPSINPNNYEIAIRNLRIDFENMAILPTLVSGNTLDIIITYPHDLATMIEIGYFGQLASFGFNIPEMVMYNEYAIYLRYFPIFSDYVVANGELVLAVVINTERTERVQRFLEMLLEQN